MSSRFRLPARAGWLLCGATLLAIHHSHADEVLAPADRVRSAERIPAAALNFDDLKLTVPHELAISFGLNDSFTIEGWLNIDRFQRSNEIVVEKEGSYGIRRAGNTNKLAFVTKGKKWDELVASSDVPFGTWFHIAVVYDGTTKEKRLYFDGVLDNPQPQSITRLDQNTKDLVIGGTDPHQHYDGRIDAVRLWNIARSGDEIMADLDRDLTGFDYGTSTADRSVTGLLGEWRFERTVAGTVPDSSGQSRDATSRDVAPTDLVDGLAFRPPPPLAGGALGALAFDGSTGAVVEVENDPLLDDLNNRITVEAWVYLDRFDRAWQGIVTNGDAWRLVRNNQTSKIAFRTTNGGTTHDLVSTGSLVPKRWHHLAATWDGQDKRIYLDGILNAKAAWAGPLDSALPDLLIGGGPDANREFKGRIDTVRVWALARSVEEIDANRWEKQRGFENGLRGAWRFDEAAGSTAFDSSYLANHGNLASGVTRVNGLEMVPPDPPVANVPPPEGGALYFPSDLAMKSTVMLPADERLEVVEAMTVEGWVSVSSYADKDQGIITRGQTWGLLLDETSNRLNFQTRRGSAFLDLTSTVPLALDRWYHVAAVFDGSQKHLYLDGELNNSTDFVGTLELNPLDRVVFSGNHDSTAMQVPFHGRMDTVRLWSDARTQSEIQAEMARELRGTEAGLIGTWRFEDNLPGNDSSWHRLHGVLAGVPPAFAPLNVNGLPFGLPPDGALALDFNRDAGDEDFVTFGADPSLDFSSRMSVETWIFVDEIPPPGESYALVSKGDTAWELRLKDNGKINFYTSGVTLDDTLDENNNPKPGTPFPDLLSVNRIEPGIWYHVAAVWDGTGAKGRKEIYLNGQFDVAREDLEASISSNSRPVLVGGRPLDDAGSAQAMRLVGILDEVRLWNVPLAGLQIRSAFDNQLHGDELGLIGSWPFSQGGRNSDGTESTTVLDQTLAPRPAIDGSFSDSMGILNRVEGVVLGPPGARQYSLSLNGTDEYIDVPAHASFEIAGGSLTIEAWINPTGSGLRTVVMQGDLGYGLALDEQNRLRFFVNGSPINSLASTGSVTNGQWQQVAVVVDGVAGTTTFYIDGLAAGVSQVANISIRPGEPLIIGRLGTAGGGYYQGHLDEVRIWSSARSATEVEFFALQPLASGELPGLAGYWQFNEGRELIAGNSVPGGPAGNFNNMDASNWAAGHFFEGGSIGQALNLAPVAGSEGLWLGTVLLTHVNEVQTAIGGESNELSPTGDTLSMRILLHADAGGAVRLLKDVIIMGAPTDPADPNSPLRLVLVTDPLLIPQFQGVVERSGRRVGIRYGTIDFDFGSTELVLLGGLGPGVDTAGRITLARGHPNNPFRHKYHPQHRNGFQIIRQFSLSFDSAPQNPATAPPGFGTDWITGTYRETIGGLHKIPLKTAGRFQLNRVNRVSTLNE